MSLIWRRYAYDFPTVFGNALRELWTARAIAGEPGSVPKGAHSCQRGPLAVPETLDGHAGHCVSMIGC